MDGLRIHHHRCQPFGVQIQAAVPIAPVSDLSTSETGAFIIPFWPWPIRPREEGLAAGVDGHHSGRRKRACPTPRRYESVPKAG